MKKNRKIEQMDLFEETLEKKIARLDRWIFRLQKEMWFLKEVYHMSKKAEKIDISNKRVEQVDMFGT